MINPDDDLELKEDPIEDSYDTEDVTVSYAIYDEKAPVFGRIAVALLIAEAAVELFPYIYGFYDIFAGSLYERLKAATIALALSTFSKPIFIGALIVSLVSIVKGERRTHAYVTLIILAVIFCYFMSNVIGTP